MQSDKQTNSFVFPLETRNKLDQMIIEAYAQKDKSAGSKSITETINQLKGKQLEVYMPCCRSILFEKLLSELKKPDGEPLTDKELILIFHFTAKKFFNHLVGEGNFVIHQFIHYLTEIEGESFYNDNPDLREICLPIEMWRDSLRYKHCRAELDKLIAAHRDEWEATLTKDCESRRKHNRQKNLPFYEEQQKAYFVELCTHYLTMSIANKGSVAVILTNDASEDAVYKFAKKYAAHIAMPEHCEAGKVAYVQFANFELIDEEAESAPLEILRVQLPPSQQSLIIKFMTACLNTGNDHDCVSADEAEKELVIDAEREAQLVIGELEDTLNRISNGQVLLKRGIFSPKEGLNRINTHESATTFPANLGPSTSC